MKTFDEIDYKKNQYKLLLSISVLVFLVMLIFTIFYFVNYNQKYGYFTKSTASVIEYENIENKDYAVIQYFIDDVEYQKTTEFTHLKIGDKITIFYDKDNPVGIIYNRDYKYYVLPIITTIFGLADLTLCILFFLHYRTPKKQVNEGVKEKDVKSKDLNADIKKKSK